MDSLPLDCLGRIRCRCLYRSVVLEFSVVSGTAADIDDVAADTDAAVVVVGMG